jgi:hypothetical protein
LTGFRSGALRCCFLLSARSSIVWNRSELHQAVQSEESLSFLLGFGPA